MLRVQLEVHALLLPVGRERSLSIRLIEEVNTKVKGGANDAITPQMTPVKPQIAAQKWANDATYKYEDNHQFTENIKVQ